VDGAGLVGGEDLTGRLPGIANLILPREEDFLVLFALDFVAKVFNGVFGMKPLTLPRLVVPIDPDSVPGAILSLVFKQRLPKREEMAAVGHRASTIVCEPRPFFGVPQ